MRRFWVLVGAWLWATAAFAQGPATSAPPPLEAFGVLPALEEMQISPDGGHLAYVTTDGDQRQLVVQERDGQKVDAVVKLGRIKLRGVVTLDGEDHWGSRGETRLKLLQAVMDFLIKNNPPGP